MTDKTGVEAEGSIIPPKLMIPTMLRQHSYQPISRLIAESMSIPGSPLTPSPEGAVEVMSILTKLEEVELESRHLLTNLFSLLETDPRLKTYIHRKLQDPNSVSAMWQLVEQLLVAGPNHIGKGVHVSDEPINERFKVRAFDMEDRPFLAHPPTDAPTATGSSSAEA